MLGMTQKTKVSTVILRRSRRIRYLFQCLVGSVDDLAEGDVFVTGEEL